jgi:hypothetical protein
VARRPDPNFDFVRAGVATGLKALYSHILSETIPENMADLLKQLDPPKERNRDDDE